MLSRGPGLYSSDSLAARSAIIPTDAASTKSMGATRLLTILTIYAGIEFLAVACSAYISGDIYQQFMLHASLTNTAYVLAAISIATLVFLTSLGLHNFIGIRRQPRHVFLWRGLTAVWLAFSFIVTILFFTQLAGYYSRGTLIFQIIAVSIAIVSSRTLFHSWLQSAIRSNKIEARRVVLIGTVSDCSKFTNRLESSGIRVIDSIRLPKCPATKVATDINPNACKITNGIRHLRADDIIVLTDNKNMSAMFCLTSSLAELPAGIHIVPVDALKSLATAEIIEFGNLKTIQVYRPPLATFDLFIKRTFDLIFAIIGLIVLSPLFLIVSIAIKLESPGPVFFRQTRHGFNNEEIRVFKFRSMTAMENGDQFTQATENDPRVTRVGRIIRNTNLDELPQLINVLRGEMSLVGPRPHPTALNTLFNNMIGRFSRRHNVKPGITGWAQVNGYRGATDTFEKMQQRIEYDLYYVDNWSFLFDVKIIMMTLFSKRAYTNAY
jgi:Undecaprenyl-phosphate glucose phosphotransferase